MTTTSPAWQQAAASILLSYTLRGALLSFLYLVLPATLRADGMSLTFTALSSLVFLPVGLTWLWSTAIEDRNPGSGRRRWITGALLVAAAAFGVMAMLDPVADYAAVLTAAMIVAAAAATIATATDAAIIDGVPVVVYRGWANALQPTGVALGGLAIAGVGSIYARHGWTVAALSMAAAASVAAVIYVPCPRSSRDLSWHLRNARPHALRYSAIPRRAVPWPLSLSAAPELICRWGSLPPSRSMPDCRWLRWRWLATCSALLPV